MFILLFSSLSSILSLFILPYFYCAFSQVCYGIRAMNCRFISFIYLQLRSYQEHILLHSQYLLHVSVGQTQDSLANHSLTLVNPSEIIYERIADQLTDLILNHKIKVFSQQIETEFCTNLLTAFWHRHQHIVQLPYEKDFNERQIPTKARPIQMNNELLEHCKKEIEDLLNKGLIRKSKSPWSCAAFYVNKQAKLE